jgi:hypothetical protein
MSYTFRSLLAGELYELPSGISVNMGFELSDLTGAKIQYPTNGVNADRLVEDATVIAYYNGTELLNGRWWLQGSEGEEYTDDTPVKTIMGKNLFTIFDKVVVHTSAGTDKVTFSNHTPGAMLISLFTAAQARGAMTGVTWNFTATNDSDGVPWANSYAISFAMTDTYLKVIQGMLDNAWAEFAWSGTQFRAYNAFGAGSDLSASVQLVAGRDYLELPYKASIEDRIHYALVAGDEASRSGYAAAGAAGPYGREEAGATQGGVTTATLDIFAFNLVRDNNKNAKELTRKMVISATSPVPGFTFVVGDQITELIGSQATVRRVKAIAIGINANGQADVSLTLGDRILDSEVQRIRMLNALTWGSVRPTGGTGTPQPPPPTTVADANTPSAPTALGGTTDGYLDTNGVFRAYVALAWTPPTTNTDASAITDLSGYEVQWKRSTTGSMGWSSIRVTDPSVTIAMLEANRNHDFRVRALDNASPPHLSAWSSTFTLTTSNDNIAPPTPATPSAVITRGTATIEWNGLSSTGASMGVDFLHVTIHRSQVNNFTPDTSGSTTAVGLLGGKGFMIFSDQAYGVTWYYKLVAHDGTGNLSPASAQVSATTAPLVAGDLATGVAGNKVYYSTSAPVAQANMAGDIWWHRNASNQIIGMYVGQGGTTWQSMPYTNSVIANLDAGKITTGSLDADRIAANSIDTDKMVAGAVTATILDADAVNGKTITGVTIIGSTLTTAASGERIGIVGGTGSSDNEIRFYPDTSGEVSVIRSENPYGNVGQKVLTVESPIKYRADATVPNYQQYVLMMGDTYDLSDVVSGMTSYVLASPLVGDFDPLVSEATPVSWIIQEDGKINLLGDERIWIDGPLYVPDMFWEDDGFTDTSFTSTSSTAGVDVGARGGQVVFTAPYSGRVMIFFVGTIRSSAIGTATAAHGVQLRSGAVVNSGTVIRAYNWWEGCHIDNSQYTTCMGWMPVTGLTRGTSYNVAQKYSAVAGSAAFGLGRVMVVPQ